MVERLEEEHIEMPAAALGCSVLTSSYGLHLGAVSADDLSARNWTTATPLPAATPSSPELSSEWNNKQPGTDGPMDLLKNGVGFGRLRRLDVVLTTCGGIRDAWIDRSFQLLTRDPSSRLGGSLDDAQEVQRHPFFAPLDWDRVMRREVKGNERKGHCSVPLRWVVCWIESRDVGE